MGIGAPELRNALRRKEDSWAVVETLLNRRPELSASTVRLAYQRILEARERLGYPFSYSCIIVHPNCPEDVLIAVSLGGDDYDSGVAARILANRRRNKREKAGDV
ncbi:MAG: hypothetical protein AB1330_01585 [Bacillota bacterium]